MRISMTYSAIFLLLFLTAFLILAVMWCAQSILSRKPRTTAKAPRPPSPNTGTVDDALLYCSFCSKDQHAVRKLIAGPAVFICDECTARFAKRTRTTSLERWNAAAKDLPKPADIQAVLDPCLAGNAYTKRRIPGWAQPDRRNSKPGELVPFRLPARPSGLPALEICDGGPAHGLNASHPVFCLKPLHNRRGPC